jgi:hypothetical protein
MPYAYFLESWYAVDAAWFYSAANGKQELDDDGFERAVENTGLPREDAISGLLRPHLTRMGFAADSWSVVPLTDDYIAYEGFPYHQDYGRELILFDTDALFSTAENYPSSKTISFTRAHERLAKLLGIDELFPVDMLRLERWEQVEEEADEEEEAS